MFTTKHSAELCNIKAFNIALDKYLQSQHIKSSTIQDIELAVEELLVNIINYNPQLTEPIELCCEKNEKTLTCRIIDGGIPFDPTNWAAPELECPIEDRIHGGMGIYLAKSLVDNMAYQRSGNKNILSLTILKQTDEIIITY